MDSKLSDRIEHEFLPLVMKPGRYVGNELNSHHKDHVGRVRVALAFPDLYEIGMSHMGLQILYHRINSLDYAVAERVFAPAPDAEDRLKSTGIPLFSIESRTSLREFDLLGFTVAYELCSTNILTILDLADIPLRSKDRGDDDPIVMLGGSCTFNPEPLAEFADAVFLGDGEDAVVEIVDALRDSQDVSRDEKIARLSKIGGVYIPSYYRAEYDSGRFAKLDKLDESAPDIVYARKVDELKPDYYPTKPIVPFVEITHDRLSVEIMRGCGRACRFCQAGVIYRPRRDRKPVDIIDQATKSLAATGFSDLTLLSLSSSDYPELENVVTALTPILQEHRVTLSLPSLRPNGLSPSLARKLSASRKAGLTLAPEAGTDRLRKVINKPVPEEEFLEAVNVAFDNDYQLLKLYFMVGLPTETDEDLDGIGALLKKVARMIQCRPGRKTINVTTSPFCPKAHTPWQWEKQAGYDEILEKQKYISKMSPRSVNVKFRSPEVTLLESALGRGDRRVADVIEHAYRNGARLDAWSEHFKYELWLSAYEACELSMKDYHREIPFDAPLPWDHISKGIKKESLKREALRSREITVDDSETADQSTAVTLKPEQPDSSVEFGRRSKRVKVQTGLQVPNSRVRVKWSKSADVRFLSHLDNTRVFERALRRGNIAVAYSQGFHPHQKIAFGPPLTLGYASDAEYFDVQLEAPYNTEMFDRLNAVLPNGFYISQTKPLFGKSQSLSSRINVSVYEIELPMSSETAAERRDQTLTMESLVVSRKTKTDVLEIDIRPGILELNLRGSNGTTLLEMTCGFGTLTFARPAEVLQHGFGLTEEEIAQLAIKRTELLIQIEDKRLTPFEIP
ncbi:MAG: TIGR03960 family B12-binding radical SAM protein [candidate division Zixibacteria bacterium]|nr:TIGR03960 family B12-binding radical SAM protein [candidate division Zixibacteria bacterium]MBU1470399.1 TIGR03960 family B12-binding radical SAM protein [candidate division Zixibacteria bacterium]